MSTTKMTISLLAVSEQLFSLLSSPIAFSPNGVAALPSPKRFALMFIVMLLKASLFLSSLGNKGRSRGAKSFEMRAVNPLSSAIFIMPDHKHKIPAIVNSSSIDDEPLSIKAEESDSVLPRNSADSTLMIINPAHT